MGGTSTSKHKLTLRDQWAITDSQWWLGPPRPLGEIEVKDQAQGDRAFPQLPNEIFQQIGAAGWGGLSRRKSDSFAIMKKFWLGTVPVVLCGTTSFQMLCIVQKLCPHPVSQSSFPRPADSFFFTFM